MFVPTDHKYNFFSNKQHMQRRCNFPLYGGGPLYGVISLCMVGGPSMVGTVLQLGLVKCYVCVDTAYRVVTSSEKLSTLPVIIFCFAVIF